MKLIKKIAAIMFAFMMVVSMSCNVKAEEGTTPTTETGEGKITINNAIPRQTYTIYKILDLESYRSNVVEGNEIGNFAYKPSSEWKAFLEGDDINNKYITFDGEYVLWKENADPAAFAKLALDYAKKDGSPVKAYEEKSAPDASTGQTTSTVTFDKLSLGYYLVDSSVGALCSLDTTKPGATIQEKNGVPSVEKGVSNAKNGTYGTSNNASIGDKVYFKTTITAQKGAQNYVLHDKMTAGLKFNGNVCIKKGESPVATSYYTLKTSDFNDDCTFEIVFGQTFCDDLQKDEKITVTYSATLNENAVIGNDANTNTNKTLLSYGDSQKTTEVTTNTKTFEMNVFKFYKDKKNSDKETGLAGATFKLTKDSQNAENIGFVKTSNKTATNDVYRVAKKGETDTVTTITSPKSGKFTIQGLGAGTYYLTETKQPDGYNKLSGPVTVVIDKDGQVKVKNGDAYDEVTQVKVENKSGTVLPSTGGAGTTMIYLIGGALVLGSGVVLVTKRRVKGK